MVILDKDERGFTSGLLDDGIRKDPVDLAVTLPIPKTKYGPVKGGVAQRPQAFIGKAAVVGLFDFPIEPDAAQCVGGSAGWDRHVAAPIGRHAVSIAATVCYPNTTGGPHDRVQRHGESAGGLNTLHAVRPPPVEVRFAIRYGNYADAVELGPQQFMECVLGPYRSAVLQAHSAIS